MGRPTRPHFHGAIFHVCARGNGGQNVFRDERDYRKFLKLVDQCKLKMDFSLLAFCLMGNHFHMQIRVSAEPIWRVMHWLLGTYSRWFNTRWGTEGHLFYERYNARLCKTERDLLTVLRYVHCNPLKDGFVASIDAWPWSSHHEYVGVAARVDTAVLGALLGGVDGYKALLASFQPRQGPFGLDTLDELSRRETSRAGFIREALAQGYRKTDLAKFLGISRPVVSRLARRAC